MYVEVYKIYKNKLYDIYAWLHGKKVNAPEETRQRDGTVQVFM